MKITEILAEANPHNYDSDVDYYAALNKEKHTAKYGRHHNQAPTPPMSDQDSEDELLQKRGNKAAKASEGLQYEWNDHEGVAKNGQKYNTELIIRGNSVEQVTHAMRSQIDHHYGAKKAVFQDIIQAKTPGGHVYGKICFVDNHKYGSWKPWKDEQIGESATAGATSAANIGTVDAPQLSPGKARGKKSYLGSPSTGSGTKAPPQPKVVQPKAADGTAKNALDMKGANLFGGATVKRS